MNSKEEMNSTYAICQREVELLQDNLSRFLLESAKCADYIVSYCKCDEETVRSGGDGEPLRALTAFKNYMSQMETITDMARKFNFHLNLNSKVFTNTTEEIFKPRFVKRFTDITNTQVKCCENEVVKPPSATVKVHKAPIRAVQHIECEAIPITKTKIEKKVQKRHVCLQVNTYHSQEKFLQMDLSMFEKGFEFEAPITYIEETESLIFYAQYFNQHIYNLSENMNFTKLDAPLANGDVFGLSMTNKFVLRATMQLNDRVKLLDFGDIIPMNSKYVYFQLPKKYQDIPAHALRCKLCGINEPNIYDRDRPFLYTILKQLEFKVHRFRVEGKSNHTLVVRIIDVHLDEIIVNADPPIRMSAHIKADNEVPKTMDPEIIKIKMHKTDKVNSLEQRNHIPNAYNNIKHKHVVPNEERTAKSKDTTYTLSDWLKDEIIGKCRKETAQKNKKNVNESNKQNLNSKISTLNQYIDTTHTEKICSKDAMQQNRTTVTKYKSEPLYGGFVTTKYNEPITRNAKEAYESDYEKPATTKNQSKQKKRNCICLVSNTNLQRAITIRNKPTKEVENIDMIEHFDKRKHHYIENTYEKPYANYHKNEHKRLCNNVDLAKSTDASSYDSTELSNQRTSTIRDRLYMQQLDDRNIEFELTEDNVLKKSKKLREAANYRKPAKTVTNDQLDTKAHGDVGNIITKTEKRYIIHNLEEHNDIPPKYLLNKKQKNICEECKATQCPTNREIACITDNLAMDDSKRQLQNIANEVRELKRNCQTEAEMLDLDKSIEDMEAKDEHKELLKSFKRECEKYKLKNKYDATCPDETNMALRDKIGAFAGDYMEYGTICVKAATQKEESKYENCATNKKGLQEPQTTKLAVMQTRSEERDKKVEAIMKELSEMTLREDFLFTTDELNNNANDLNTVHSSCETDLYVTKAAINPATFLNTKEIHILSVTVTNVADVNTFYVQVQHKSWRQPMIWNDNEISLSRKMVKSPQVNELVMAQYICDQYWYRAEIQNIDPIRQLYEVFYVDFGSRDSVPLSCLAECNSNQLRLPYLGIRCHFANIHSVVDTEVLRREAIDLLNVILLNKTFRAELKYDGTEMAVKILDSNFPDVPRVLLNMGFVELNESVN